MTDEPRGPLFLVRGEAGDEEVAALTVVLQAITASAAAARDREQRPGSQWAVHHRRLRQPLVTGPGAWRASGLPR